MSTLTNSYAASAPASDPFSELSYPPSSEVVGDDQMAPAPTWGSEPAAGAAPGGSGGGGSGSHHMAMPQLLGAPAYARPPRVVAESPRPLDPDDLPIEAMRSPEDQALISAAYQQPVDDSRTAIQPSSQGGLRAVASRLFGSGS